MSKNVFRLSCPCCGKKIEVDKRSGKARPAAAVKPPPGPGPDLGEGLEVQKKESQRLGDAFERASQATTGNKERLDDLFSDAVENAKEDKDEKPPNPFDFD